MPPRVRGERSTDTPRTQAASERHGGLRPRGVGRSPGPAMAGPASALNA